MGGSVTPPASRSTNTKMGNANLGCTPTLAVPGCTPSMASGSCTTSFTRGKSEEWQDPCMPTLGATRGLDPLGDQQCMNISLVQATIRGDARDVARALASGAQPNTTAELTLKMGDAAKDHRRGKAGHVTPLMRACE